MIVKTGFGGGGVDSEEVANGARDAVRPEAVDIDEG